MRIHCIFDKNDNQNVSSTTDEIETMTEKSLKYIKIETSSERLFIEWTVKQKETVSKIVTYILA